MHGVTRLSGLLTEETPGLTIHRYRVDNKTQPEAGTRKNEIALPSTLLPAVSRFCSDYIKSPF